MKVRQIFIELPPRPALPLFQGKKVIKAPTFLLAALSSLFIFHNQINKRWIDLVWFIHVLKGHIRFYLPLQDLKRLLLELFHFAS